ncbi:hypothetical protein LA080_012010 [Diaporthe eres]|nr:hypothetical protein LA080_012010 [Diaporthe eres]
MRCHSQLPAHFSIISRVRSPLGGPSRHAWKAPDSTNAHICSHGRGYSTQVKDRTIKGPTIMEAFAGIGNFAVAATKLGYPCVYANEINPDCVETYEKNHCRGGPGISKVDRRDIRTVTRVMSHATCMLPIATIACGGFPCQNFSNNGNREGLDDPKNGDLFYCFVKLLIHLQNPIALLENVMSFSTVDKFKGMSVAQKELEEAGYHVSSHIYNAVDFNLPQNRDRCFIVAIREDLAASPFEFKKPPSRRQDLALTDVLDLRNAIEDLSQYTLVNEVWVPKRIIKGVQAEIKWKSGKPEDNTGYKGLRTVGRWTSKYNSGSMIYHHSGFAACITTKAGDWYQVPGPDGRDIIVRLSLRERLRLQGLHEDFELSGSLTSAWKQVGNSVPPPMVEWIFRCLQDQFPHVLTSDTYSTTEVWDRVQPRNRSLQDQTRATRQLKNLSTRKSRGKERREDEKARREAEKALREGNGALEASDSESVKTGRATGSGKSDATRTKRLNDLGERIKALEKGIASLKMEHKLLAKAQPGRK